MHAISFTSVLAGVCVATVAAVASDSECVEKRDGGLCVVDIRKHSFRAPNLLLPKETRGVYWIDAENMTGKSNPWVDLNFLQKAPSHTSTWFRHAAGSSDELLYVMDGGSKKSEVHERLTAVR